MYGWGAEQQVCQKTPWLGDSCQQTPLKDLTLSSLAGRLRSGSELLRRGMARLLSHGAKVNVEMAALHNRRKTRYNG